MSMLSRATGTTRERRARDFYPTIDPRAVVPLVRHLGGAFVYAEPCAGAGDLIDLLDVHGCECLWAADLLPMRRTVHSTGQLIAQQDALLLDRDRAMAPPMFVTNPAWDRPVLHALIKRLAPIAPTWLLFDAAWKETQQAARFGPWCSTIISVGRLRWIEGTDDDATDDCSWYCFDARPGAIDLTGKTGTRFVWPTSRRESVDQLCLL